jgi:uncharacterized protein YdbL (DUF1318 family)
MFKRFLSSLLVAGVLVAAPAFAISLDDAKSQGLVGEDSSGYVAAVTSPPSKEVRDLMREVNDKRREEYARIASQNKISVSDVEKLAGQKAIEKTESGNYIRLPNSDWQRQR